MSKVGLVEPPVGHEPESLQECSEAARGSSPLEANVTVQGSIAHADGDSLGPGLDQLDSQPSGPAHDVDTQELGKAACEEFNVSETGESVHVGHHSVDPSRQEQTDADDFDAGDDLSDAQVRDSAVEADLPKPESSDGEDLQESGSRTDFEASSEAAHDDDDDDLAVDVPGPACVAPSAPPPDLAVNADDDGYVSDFASEGVGSTSGVGEEAGELHPSAGEGSHHSTTAPLSRDPPSTTPASGSKPGGDESRGEPLMPPEVSDQHGRSSSSVPNPVCADAVVSPRVRGESGSGGGFDFFPPEAEEPGGYQGDPTCDVPAESSRVEAPSCVPSTGAVEPCKTPVGEPSVQTGDTELQVGAQLDTTEHDFPPESTLTPTSMGLLRDRDDHSSTHGLSNHPDEGLATSPQPSQAQPGAVQCGSPMERPATVSSRGGASDLTFASNLGEVVEDGRKVSARSEDLAPSACDIPLTTCHGDEQHPPARQEEAQLAAESAHAFLGSLIGNASSKFREERGDLPDLFSDLSLDVTPRRTPLSSLASDVSSTDPMALDAKIFLDGDDSLSQSSSDCFAGALPRTQQSAVGGAMGLSWKGHCVSGLTPPSPAQSTSPSRRFRHTALADLFAADADMTVSWGSPTASPSSQLSKPLSVPSINVLTALYGSERQARAPRAQPVSGARTPRTAQSCPSQPQSQRARAPPKPESTRWEDQERLRKCHQANLQRSRERDAQQIREVVARQQYHTLLRDIDAQMRCVSQEQEWRRRELERRRRIERSRTDVAGMTEEERRLRYGKNFALTSSSQSACRGARGKDTSRRGVRFDPKVGSLLLGVSSRGVRDPLLPEDYTGLPELDDVSFHRLDAAALPRHRAEKPARVHPRPSPFPVPPGGRKPDSRIRFPRTWQA